MSGARHPFPFVFEWTGAVIEAGGHARNDVETILEERPYHG